MVEREPNVLDRSGEIIEMEDQPRLPVRLAFDADARMEGMAVDARIRMPRRRRREEVGGFESELFIDQHGSQQGLSAGKGG